MSIQPNAAQFLQPSVFLPSALKNAWPLLAAPQQPIEQTPEKLLAALLAVSRVQPENGVLLLPEAAIKAAVKQYKAVLIPALLGVLSAESITAPQNPARVATAFYIAQCLAEDEITLGHRVKRALGSKLGTLPTQALYPLALNWSHTPNGLVATYLAGFFRALNEQEIHPELLGILQAMLLRQVLKPQPEGKNYDDKNYDVNSAVGEIGGTMYGMLLTGFEREMKRLLNQRDVGMATANIPLLGR